MCVSYGWCSAIRDIRYAQYGKWQLQIRKISHEYAGTILVFFCSFGRDVRSFTEADEMNSRMPKSKCKKKKMKDNKIEFQAERRLFCHQHYIAFVVINTNNEWKKK